MIQYRSTILLLEVPQGGNLCRTFSKVYGVVSKYGCQRQVFLDGNLLTWRIVFAAISPCCQRLAFHIQGTVGWNGELRTELNSFFCGYNTLSCDIAKFKGNLDIVGNLPFCDRLNSKIRYVRTALNGQCGSVTLIEGTDNVIDLVLMVAGTSIRRKRGNHLCAVGILHGDVSAPCTGAERNLHGTLHWHRSLEVDPAVVVLTVATFHDSYDVGIVQVSGETRRTVSSHQQTQFQVAVVNLVARQQIAVQ